MTVQGISAESSPKKKGKLSEEIYKYSSNNAEGMPKDERNKEFSYPLTTIN